MAWFEGLVANRAEPRAWPAPGREPIWRLRTGAPWRDVPGRYGKWNSIYRRFRRWSDAGVWKAVSVTLAEIMADSGHYSIDSTTVRAHVSAAGGKGGTRRRALGRSRGGFTSKLYCLADARGRPVAFHLTSGEAADCKAYDTLIALPDVPRMRCSPTRVMMPTPRRSRKPQHKGCHSGPLQPACKDRP
jgi:transposase